MSTKIITLEERFYTGEPTVQLVTTLGRDGRALRERTSLHMSKTAAQSPAMDFIRSVQPEPGKTIVLVIGLGDHETYGPNRNGDGFPSEPIPGKITPDQVLTKHFQSYDNAHVFEHHVNHDPSKAIGKVIKAFWNPHMRRVEVLESFDHDKAPHLLEKVTSGQYPSKSMGCFVAGTMITMADGTRKKIEEIEIGDCVLTAEGRGRRVTELHRRPYTGAGVTLRGEALESVTATANHPYLVVAREDVRKKDSAGAFRWAPDPRAVPRWVEAGCLDKDAHLLLVPIDREELTPDYVTRAFARLFGYYMAEGHIIFKKGEPYAVQYSVHRDDAIHAEIAELCADFGTENPPATFHVRATEYSRSILVCDPLLAQLCMEHGGTGARTKSLSQSAMQWRLDMQREMLGAYANGDGHGISVGPQTGTLKLSTANRCLAEQWVQISHRLGLIPSIQCLTHKAGKGFSRTDTHEYVLHYGKSFAQELRGVCAKVVDAGDFTVKRSRAIVGDYVAVPIRDLERLELACEVFNFEVEEDETYTAGWVAVHNCKIPYDLCSVCANKAATRGEYCDHLKYEMGRIYPDGKQAAALNPSPRFFDSSWVIRPADRTGHMLKKVAREHAYELRMPSYELSELVEAARHKSAALGKAADMEKVVTGLPEASATSTDKGTLKLIKRYSDEIAPSEASSIPKSDVRITIEYTPDEAIGTTDAMGLPMGLKELVQYFMGRAGAEGTPSDRDLDCACKHAEALFEIFSEYPRFYDDVMKVAGLSAPRVNEKLANAIWPPSTMVQDRSLNDAALQDRKLPALPQYGASPNTDVLTFTDPSGQTYRTNMGMARRATNALEPEAYGKKYMRGAGYMGLGTLLGTAGLGSLLLGKRTPMRTFLGGTAIGGGLAAGAKGLHEMARPLRVGDLPGPKVMTNEGYTIPAYTEMKAAAWRPEMLYTVLRHRDGGRACATLEPQRKLAFQNAVRRAEVHDDLSAVLGPTLELEKVALLLEQSISTLA